jgi:murein tripeptide amidase MpaA
MRFYITIISLLSFVQLFGQIKTPDQFLPHAYGEQFTPHHLLVDYFEYVAANSEKVQLIPYGKTNQGRPLMVAVVSSESNLQNLESIRLNNLRLAGLESGQADVENAKAIVWLSYSVHGNEPSGSECSMQVLYDLVDPNNSQSKAWLENTIVIMDPAVNPDGYSRYTHWYRNAANKILNPNLDSREHNEPWPGGRVNHYLFDLNRDWAWATQIETQQRLKLYQEWMPHVHPDVHEQYIDNPYYFAPAAEPFHQYITQWQRDFQTEIGKNHAGYFDENGWLYFTREIFDLFYPSYGDTYPTFNGAIGMTYEQAGHSTAGSAALMRNGDTLLLKDRIAHHHTTSMSTIEMTSKHASRVLKNFKAYFDEGKNNPQGKYKTFVIRNKEEDASKIRALLTLLDRHKIQYGKVGSSKSGINGFDYQANKTGSFSVKENDLIISAYQPKSVLAQVLFEPESVLSDSLTYDITAWALPYAYGLETYATTTKILPSDRFEGGSNARNMTSDLPYAWVARWEDVSDAKFLGALLKEGIKVRYANTAFSIEGKSFKEGSLVVTKADNGNKENWSQTIQEIANEQGKSILRISTGFADTGKDLGSYLMELVEAPNVAMIYGEEVDSYTYGFIWSYFEQSLEYGINTIPFALLNNGNLKKYNVLILPEGSYELTDETLKILKDWANAGGKVICIGSAHQKFVGKEGFQLKEDSTEEKQSEIVKDIHIYGETERSSISLATPGAIVKVNLDTSHPLSYGLGSFYYSLKTNDFHQPYLEKGWNVGYLGDKIEKKGFIGAALLKKMPHTLVFGVEDSGEGSFIYLLDNPLFRGFWHEGELLFSNALFF